MNGRRRIMHLASALRLGSAHVDQAFRYFVLAVQHNFTQGRRTPNVVAACLYIVCRKNKSPHMLIDFSDVLQTNLFVLGNAFFRLCQTLDINPPLVDPSLYIHRFAAALGLGDEELPIASTALRLVQRMKRDWIQIGRRPAGVCGAALQMAARIHRKPVSTMLILQTVKVCDMTLRRRVKEFSELPSAALSIEEFKLRNPEVKLADIDSTNWTDETSEDPPIFKKHQNAIRVKEQADLLARQIENAQAHAMSVVGEYQDSEFAKPEEAAYQVERAQREAEEDARRAMPPPSSTTTAAIKKRAALSDPSDLSNAAQLGAKRRAELAQSKQMPPPKEKTALAAEFDSGLQDMLDQSPLDDPASNHGIGVDEQMSAALEEAQASHLDTMELGVVNAPPLAISGSGVGEDPALTNLTVVESNPEDEIWDASDIPDEEIEEYLNTPDQASVKLELWEELNREWMEDQEERARQAALDEAAGRPPRKTRKKGPGGSSSPAPPKERSRKVNWEAINAHRQRREAGLESMSSFLSATEGGAAPDGSAQNFGDELDEDEEEPFVAPIRPPPSAYLGSLRPSIPAPGSKPGTQASQTQSTQLYGMDDDDDDDVDLDADDEPAAGADEFTSHFKGSNDDYDEGDW